MEFIGTFDASSTVRLFFTTHAASGAAVAPSSGFEAADVRVYKNGSNTQRSSEAGFTMTSPFDSVTGLHLLELDTSDNTDAGFWAAGNTYTVVLVPDETVDSLAVVRVLGQFAIERVAKVNVTQFAGSAVTSASGIPEVKVASIAADAITATSIASDAITAAKIAADAIGASELAADAVAEIQSGLATAANLATVAGYIDTEIGTIISALTTIDGVVDAIEIDTQDIQSRLPAALTGDGNMKADALKFDGTAPVQTSGKLWVLDGSGNAIAAAAALGTVGSDVLTNGSLLVNLHDTIEDDGGTYRFTANALEEAPTGGSAPSAADIRAEIDANSTQLATIVGDTNELQTDWANGGRLDLILDARASQASVDDLPTNAELATALGTADDAVLAAIVALNNLSQADIRTAIGMASANLDTQIATLATAASLSTVAGNITSILGYVDTEIGSIITAIGDVPTNSELAVALAAADDAVLAAIAALNDLSAAQVNAEVDQALADYDAPTRTEATSDKDEILAVLGTPAISTIAADIADVRAGLDNVETDTQDIQGRLPTSLVSGRIDASVGAMAADTVTASALAADAVAELAIPTAAQNADALLGRTISGGADGGRDVRSALRVIRNKVSITGGTMPVTEEDDATSAWTGTVTTTAGNPISAVDPS